MSEHEQDKPGLEEIASLNEHELDAEQLQDVAGGAMLSDLKPGETCHVYCDQHF